MSTLWGQSIQTVLMGNLRSKFTQSDKDQAMQKIVWITYMRKKWFGEGFGFRKPSPWAPLDKFPVIEHQLLYKVLRCCSHQQQLSRLQALLIHAQHQSALRMEASPMVSLSALPQQPASTCLILNCSHQKMQSVLKKWMCKGFHYL